MNAPIFAVTASNSAAAMREESSAKSARARCSNATGLFRSSLVRGPIRVRDKTVPDVTTVGILKLELGHILGMRHEHVWADLPRGLNSSCYLDELTVEAADVTGRRLTEYDPASAMCYPCPGIPGGDFEIPVLDGYRMRRVYTQSASWYVRSI